MTRSRQSAVAVFALVGLAALTVSADAKIKRRHPAPHHPAAVARRDGFPAYIDQGADRNPGGDNLYFSDTKQPNYIVGPAWFQRWE